MLNTPHLCLHLITHIAQPEPDSLQEPTEVKSRSEVHTSEGGMIRLETRAQISQFELFELILLLKLDKRLPVEQFEARSIKSIVPPS